MLLKQELIGKIKDYFDLNIYETKVWLALLGKGIASAGEVASISRVPRSRTYDVLESLEKKGFAIVKIGKPVKYIGVKPRIILEKLKNNVKTDANEKMLTLSNIKNTEELYEESINTVKREDISSALTGKSNITNHLREIILNANKEVIICTNAMEIISKIKLFQKTVEQLKKANVDIKFALSGDEKLVKQIETKLDVKIKFVNIDAKFFIVDRTEILFYISKDSDIAIWLNSDFFSQAFAELFDKVIKN